MFVQSELIFIPYSAPLCTFSMLCIEKYTQNKGDDYYQVIMKISFVTVRALYG